MVVEQLTARRSRLPRGAGVLALQALGSMSTLVTMLLLGNVLPRGDFDDYAVWVTSGAFVLGVGQAVGSERVVIGRRTREDGLRSALALALGLALVQVAVAAWLANPVLVACSLLVPVSAVWDYLRVINGFDQPWPFFTWGVVVLGLQVVSVVAAALADLGGTWPVLVSTATGALVVVGVVARRGYLRGLPLRGGWRVLWEDRRESTPLLVDATLAGIPIVLALSVAGHLGAVGEASDARMAFTILGPVALVGIAARRVIYGARGEGEFTARTLWMIRAAVLVIFAVCFLLLSLTRTPLYDVVLPGFAALSWTTIVGFSVNHAAVAAALVPAAELRARARTAAVGLARVAATLAAVLYLVVKGYDGVHDVPWCVASASLVYAVLLGLASARLDRRAPA